MAVVDGQIEECGSVVLLCFAVGAEAVSQSDSQQSASGIEMTAAAARLWCCFPRKDRRV
jgi:hypothetical protein